MTSRTITYYAVAINAEGKIAQLFVTRKIEGVRISKSQVWTGVTYPTQRAAVADLSLLNGCAA